MIERSVEIHPVVSREEWLERRKPDVTGSTAAALLGAHEHCTALQLYMDKTGLVSMDRGDNPAMRRGRLLEPLALTLIKEQHPDWEVWPAAEYLRDPERRLGCTPDVYVRDKADRLGVVEIKSVEPGVFARTWVEDGIIRPTMASAIQVTLARHLKGADFAMVGVIRVGHGVDFDLIEVPETEGLIERLQQAADAFWRAVDRQQPPPPIFPADVDAVLRYAKSIKTTDQALELPEGDNYFPSLIAEYLQNSAEIKERKNRCETIKAEILHHMGPATALTQNGRVLARALMVHKRAEEKPRPAYSYRDFRIPTGAVNP